MLSKKILVRVAKLNYALQLKAHFSPELATNAAVAAGIGPLIAVCRLKMHAR